MLMLTHTFPMQFNLIYTQNKHLALLATFWDIIHLNVVQMYTNVLCTLMLQSKFERQSA